MRKGSAFEILVKRILMNVGFMEVVSDGLYIYDGTAGQMLQGVGESHNADVLLQPPVQIPFYTPSRLLIECKDYSNSVGLNTLRSALGLRADVNGFDIVDERVMRARIANRRRGITYPYTRYYYQVAVASMSGFTIPAQQFALTHRISLINFTNMPFWADFIQRFQGRKTYIAPRQVDLMQRIESDVEAYADEIGRRMAVAITETGQMLFLYQNEEDKQVAFNEYYTLHWTNTKDLWELHSGENKYVFELPTMIRTAWLNQTSNKSVKENAINCKAQYLSHMVVYYFDGCKPQIKMISIDAYALEEARENL